MTFSSTIASGLLLAASTAVAAALPSSHSSYAPSDKRFLCLHYPETPHLAPSFFEAQGGISSSDITSLFQSISIPPSASAAADIELIRAITALYGLALDGRNWPVLNRIVTPDARANHSNLGVMSGLEDIKTHLTAALEPVPFTQHQLGTTVVQLCRHEDATPAATSHGEGESGRQVKAAVSITYTTTAHFAAGPDGGLLPMIDAASVLAGGDSGCDADNGGDGAALATDGGWKIRVRNALATPSAADSASNDFPILCSPFDSDWRSHGLLQHEDIRTIARTSSLRHTEEEQRTSLGWVPHGECGDQYGQPHFRTQAGSSACRSDLG
ncbi:uncharacterized protein B0I36DRAFT_350659 [Microdochium trichocladiopsis]|uniref:SnoaL-like domain-containing protein n=1 Tax=Microdochium trichocladiopsis TaxID=1682393 RepID=A0A9P8Y858_9PEZI|nr:uncharacterized protein B0I36DRAFT_350659 [Microdochium trichocladiopsis]KAH7029857.1 hypothetical protein B0I36DRAFT_350659 [Microdochium trichocladiopsis]